jgi:hypothetical protein
MGSEKSEHYPMQHLTAHTHSLGRRAKPTKARRKVSASLRLPRQGTQQGARWGNTEAGMTSLRSSPTFMPLTPCSTAMSKRRSAKRRVRNNFGLTPTAKGKGDAPTARETFEQADWLLSSEKESRRRCNERGGEDGLTRSQPLITWPAPRGKLMSPESKTLPLASLPEYCTLTLSPVCSLCKHHRNKIRHEKS